VGRNIDEKYRVSKLQCSFHSGRLIIYEKVFDATHRLCSTALTTTMIFMDGPEHPRHEMRRMGIVRVLDKSWFTSMHLIVYIMKISIGSLKQFSNQQAIRVDADSNLGAYG
jgi:hypothetical protein